MPKYAEILVNKSRTYTYRIPDGKDTGLQIGSAVKVPLRNALTVGYITSFVPCPEFPTKDIAELARDIPVFDENLLKTALWMADHYRCGLPAALKTILPKQ